MLKLAGQILESKKGQFDPPRFENRYENALMNFIKAKRSGKKPPVASEERPSKVIDLVDALRRSARGDRRRRATATPRKNSSHSSSSRKRTGSRKKVRRAS